MTQTLKHHPQRLALPSSPGTLLKRAFGIAKQLKLQQTSGSDPVYLALVRQLPCFKCGLEPCGEAAHVRMNSGLFNKRGGIGKKPADKWTLSLCPACHTRDPDSQHKIGELTFWDRLGINPLLVCEKLYAARGDVVRMRAVVLAAMAGWARI